MLRLGVAFKEQQGRNAGARSTFLIMLDRVGKLGLCLDNIEFIVMMRLRWWN